MYEAFDCGGGVGYGDSLRDHPSLDFAKLLSQARRRSKVENVISEFRMSERRACFVIG